MTKKERQIKREIKNALYSSMNSEMFEMPLYSKKLVTCEEIGDIYIRMMTEVVNELINEQHLYTKYTDYIESRKK